MDNIKHLYEAYPVFKKINMDNGEIIERKAVFETICFNEYIKLALGTCLGVLFVAKGTIKIQKIKGGRVLS